VSEAPDGIVSLAGVRSLVHERHELREHGEALEAQAERDRVRIRDLEQKLAECAATCEAEATKARDAALEEAARLVEPDYSLPDGPPCMWHEERKAMAAQLRARKNRT
jgi:hypothetical protein